MSHRSPITTHVLDTATGRPAAGVAVRLECKSEAGQWTQLAEGVTDADGRILDLLAAGRLTVAVYRLTFATGEYFQKSGTDGFYPEVTVVFEIRQPDEHYHVPLLLSPFGYSTYRGS